MMTKKEMIYRMQINEAKQHMLLLYYNKHFGIDSEMSYAKRLEWQILYRLLLELGVDRIYIGQEVLTYPELVDFIRERHIDILDV